MQAFTIHYMKLWNEPFNQIKNRSKTIEMRLNDEKRQLIKINDEIVFTNVKTNEIIKTKVINLYHYKDFKDLYDHHDKISIGYNSDEDANDSDMYEYYSKEQIACFGVLAIEIEII